MKSLLIVAVLLAFFRTPLAECGPQQKGSYQGEVRVAILLYHRFGPVVSDSMYVTTTVFRSHLDYLRTNGFTVIHLRQLVEYYLKGDRGVITYRSSIPLASEIRAQRPILVRDMGELIRSLREKGIYTIARIVVFKDNLLGTARPNLTVRTHKAAGFHDRENLIWVDPSKEEVWDYNIDIAMEAARPGFLSEAGRRLAPYNVFVSADIFGYVSWNLNDTLIGQQIEKLAPCVDYLSLMLYPSGFQFGIPGYRNPVAHPLQIISLSLKRARERTGITSVRFRPWLQAFRDYAFDRRYFYCPGIREQINGAEEFGSGGWMLWNPRNVYTDAGLKREVTPRKYAGIEGPKG